MKNRMYYMVPLILMIAAACMTLTACGKENRRDTYYEIVNGQIVSKETEQAEKTKTDDAVIPMGAEGNQGITAAEAGNIDTASVSDGVSYVEDDSYNSIASDRSGRIELLKMKLETACDAARESYRTADKGTAMNITLSTKDISSMISAIGSAGLPAADSLGKLNMQAYEIMNAFGEQLNVSTEDLSETYFIVYPDGHLSGFMLSRESRIWHLYSASAAWNEDEECSIRIYSEGRYAVGEVRYTDKGWLIYSRDTSDFDENQKANTDAYVMVRVLPYDSEKRTLCERYVEPVGYLENNLFTTTWNESNMGPIDFNSLYAYVFSLYNGTDMLSSYNVRSYYKAVQGTKLYLVPEDIFENNTTVYFNIDRSALKNISDYSASRGGYYFLGYNRDYYNVTPRTPTPEVVSYTYNTDGTITMVVDAVNKWYGTDRAFRHELTVRPTDGVSFRYVSNLLYEDENNILPVQKLSEMLNVEREKLN